jgi:hypothetical protein
VQRLPAREADAATAAMIIAGTLAVGAAWYAFRDRPQVLAALAILPVAATLTLVLLQQQPLAVMALFILAQPLTAYAIPTPVGTVTADNAILLLLVATQVVRRRVDDAQSKLVLRLLIVWVGTYLFRASYLSPAGVIRELVTATSFVLIFLVARTLPRNWRTLKVLAIAGWATLSMFGLAALAVDKGLLPAPIRQSAARDIFGFVSPYMRNYGLNVAFDAIAFLGLICVPVLAYVLVAPHQSLRHRAVGLLGLGSLMWFIFYLFQARGMLLQIVLAVGVVLWLTRPLTRFLLIPILGYTILHEVQSFLSVDAISSELRLSNYTEISHIVFTQPWSLLIGRNESTVFDAGAARAGVLGAVTQGTNAIHNAFLSQLVGGGWAAFVCFTLVYWLMLRRSWRNWRANRTNAVWTVLLTASVLTIFELMVETGRAQVVGNWIVLGLVFAAGSVDRPGAVDAGRGAGWGTDISPPPGRRHVTASARGDSA